MALFVTTGGAVPKSEFGGFIQDSPAESGLSLGLLPKYVAYQSRVLSCVFS